MSDVTPIDWNRVAELRSEIGADEFGEVVELFLEEVDALIGEVRDAPEAEMEERMHALKGSALNLGFRALSDLCQVGEILAARGQSHEIDRHLVVDAYRVSRAAFLEGLRGGAIG